MRVAWVRIESGLYIVVFAVHHLRYTTALQEISKPLEILACENIRFSSLFPAKSEEKRMFSQAIEISAQQISMKCRSLQESNPERIEPFRVRA